MALSEAITSLLIPWCFHPFAVIFLFYPSAFLPSVDDVVDYVPANIGSLFFLQVIEGEYWWELVEDETVSRLPCHFLLSRLIFTEQRFTEEVALFLQYIFSCQSGKFQNRLALLSCQQTGNDSAAEAYYGSTLAVGVLHDVTISHSFYSFPFHPLTDGLSQQGSVNEPLAGTQCCYGCIDVSRQPLGFLSVDWHGSKSGIRHLGDEDA